MTQNTATYLNILQNIIVELDGCIQFSENTLFDLEIGSQIKDFHPIFISILEKAPNHNYHTSTHRGVYFSVDDHNIYCDVTIRHEINFIAVTIFNFTSNYNSKQHLTQKLNENQIICNRKSFRKHPSFL